MSEPKKRGRPSKADIAARQAIEERKASIVAGTELAGLGHVVNGDTSRQPEDVMRSGIVSMTAVEVADDMVNGARVMLTTDKAEREVAQAYALRVWNGQAADLKRAERIARCERALIGQNLPTDGIRYPGSDDADWEDGDDEPISWRMKLPKPDGIV